MHIIGTLGIGGVQTYLLDLSKHDKNFKISRSVLCLYGNKGALKKNFIENGIDCYNCNIMPSDYGIRPYRLWKLIRKIKKQYFVIKLFQKIKAINPSIIICDEPSLLNTQLFVSRLLHIPFIWHIHNEYQFDNVNKIIFDLTFNYYSNRNLFIVADSKYILNKNLLKQKQKMMRKWNRIPIIPASPDLTRIIESIENRNNHNLDRIRLGSIGRLTWQKDYQSLIEIFRIVKKRTNKDLLLTIAGTGPLEQSLHELICELKLENSVELIGSTLPKDIPKFLAGLDIYIQSSVSEGSPLTIKEAMAASLPIVSTSVGGIPEMIIDGKTGFLAPVKDYQKFADIILNLINTDSTKRKTIGKNALEFAKKNYALDLIAERQYDIYRKLSKKLEKLNS